MDVTDNSGLRRHCRAILLAALATAAAGTLPAAEPKVKFDIPAGEFSQALIEFYKQAQVEILYASPDGVAGVQTRAVVGELDVATALKMMLAGTGFVFEFENPHSVLLRRDSAAPVAVVEAGPAPHDPSPAGEWSLASLSPAPVQDVVVTGSLIRGVLDIMSPLMHVTKAEMKGTAHASVWDALQKLPVTSNAGPSDDFAGLGSNYNKGTGLNLRGLGYGATLVLVNGRRQAAAGAAADFVDVSNIPWSAVERIEVLPDGSSALYGSDAIAGVVNIVMRDDLDGAESQGRFGMTSGGLDETVYAQTFGQRGETGRWLLSYQFSEQGALAAADRRYSATSDKSALGGSDLRSIWGNPGNILSPYTFMPAYAVPRGQNGTSLSPADLIADIPNRHNELEMADLTPRRQMHSAYFTGSHQLSTNLELFTEGRYGLRRAQQRMPEVRTLLEVPSTNPFFVDPFGGQPSVYVTYGFANDLGPAAFEGETENYHATTGIKADLGREWQATVSTSYGRENLSWDEVNIPDHAALMEALADTNPATAFNPFGDGSYTNPRTLAAIRSTQSSKSASGIVSMNAVADGPLFSLPTGVAKLAVGAEFREEALRHKLFGAESAKYDRSVAAAFAELSVPLIGTAADPRALPRLELSLAGRYGSYSDFGGTFNPKVGLRWAPNSWMKLRTSWGNSFKAPNLLDLHDTSQNVSGPIILPDPVSPAGRSLVLIRQGSNPDLKEETAATWTVGADLMPVSLPGLTVSFTYYAVAYQDRILQPGPAVPTDILLQEPLWTEVINRSPSDAQIAAICNSPDFLDPSFDCIANPPAAIVDIRMRNLAATRARGIDLKLDYAFRSRFGELGFGLVGNRALRFEQALTPTSPANDIADTVGNPLGLRVIGKLDWNQNGRGQPGFGVDAAIDHIGGYRDLESRAVRRIGSSTTVDLRVAYRTAPDSGSLGNLEIALNAVNVFDSAPPFVDQFLGYDPLNYDPYGRVISVYAQKRW
jgi:iron complex outermembrane receptor protein